MTTDSCYPEGHQLAVPKVASERGKGSVPERNCFFFDCKNSCMRQRWHRLHFTAQEASKHTCLKSAFSSFG